MKAKQLTIGIILLLIAAFFSSISQVFWKIGSLSFIGIIYYIIGFILSAVGMLLMMFGFRYGDVSILQPIMAVGYIYTIPIGMIIFNETFTINKLIGTFFILAGTVLLGLLGNKEAKHGK